MLSSQIRTIRDRKIAHVRAIAVVIRDLLRTIAIATTLLLIDIIRPKIPVALLVGSVKNVDSIPVRRLIICHHRTCTKDGADAVLAAFQKDEVENVTIETSGCMGLCGSGPMVLVLPDEIYYWHINPNKAQTIIKTHLLGNTPIPSMMHPRLHPT